MRWPRTDADRELIQQLEDDKKEGRTKTAEHAQRDREHWKRRIRYQKDLTARIADMPSAGVVEATYRDLIGNEYASSAVVVMGDRGDVDDSEDDEEDVKRGVFYSTWSPVTLQTLSIREEPKEDDYYEPD